MRESLENDLDTLLFNLQNDHIISKIYMAEREEVHQNWVAWEFINEMHLIPYGIPKCDCIDFLFDKCDFKSFF